MRYVLVLAILVPALAFGQDQTVKDTTDWRAYHPLDIGNVWEREIECNCIGNYYLKYERHEITGDTIIDGRRYVLQREEEFDEDNVLTYSQTHYLRYDTTRPAIVELTETDTTRTEQVWPSPEACDLSAAFESMITCIINGGESDVAVEGRYEDETILGGLKVRARKLFGRPGSGVGIWFRNGPGDWEYEADSPPRFRNDLIYARLEGQEYGTSVIATAIEEPPPAQRTLAILSAYPNPFDKALTVRYWIPTAQRVHVSVYDALGRRVRAGRVGRQRAGEHVYQVDGEGLSAGLYVVRITSGNGRRAVARAVHVDR